MNKNNNYVDKTLDYQSPKEGEKLQSNSRQNSLNINASENEDLFFDSVDVAIERSIDKEGDVGKKMDGIGTSSTTKPSTPPFKPSETRESKEAIILQSLANKNTNEQITFLGKK